MSARSAGASGFALFLACAVSLTMGAAAAGGPPVPELTSRQRAERTRDLPPEERTWLTNYVAPIILPAERDLFLQLSTDFQREMFKREFWERRARNGLTLPLGPGYQARYARLREIAAESYDGVDSDAGRMVVRRGEPAGIEELLGCSEVYRQAEIWSYPSGSSRLRSEVRHLFYRPSFGAARRLWMAGDREIFQTGSCVVSFDQACAGSPPASRDAFCPTFAAAKRCGASCTVATIASEIQARGPAEASVLSQPLAVSTEGLDGLWQRLASVSDPGARPIPLSAGTSEPLVPAASDELSGDASSWSNEKIRDRIVALPKKYREWLDIAGPLLSRAEIVAFLRLPTGERDAYVRRFWKKHGHVK